MSDQNNNQYDKNPNLAKTVVYISSGTMGQGDDKLGAMLLGVFLDSLSQTKGHISHAIFVNDGAKLTTQDSPVLPQLQQLQQLDVNVLTCGTCLNHFGIKDKLAVGSVTNMVTIVELLSAAQKILQP